jgi:hypothetical protein
MPFGQMSNAGPLPRGNELEGLQLAVNRNWAQSPHSAPASNSAQLGCARYVLRKPNFEWRSSQLARLPIVDTLCGCRRHRGKVIALRGDDTGDVENVDEVAGVVPLVEGIVLSFDWIRENQHEAIGHGREPFLRKTGESVLCSF